MLVVQNPTENSMNNNCKKEYIQNKSEQTKNRQTNQLEKVRSYQTCKFRHQPQGKEFN